jgi:hypothetical protein
MPRRRENQWETSAITGPNVAELPRNPIRRPYAATNVPGPGAMLAAA